MKNSFFYSNAEIKEMKELIRTGEPLIAIAEREHGRFNAGKTGFYLKLINVAKNTTKIKDWDGPRIRRAKSIKAPVQPKETRMPEGFTFEGTPKKVTFCVDHFRVYF
jgi:hypothetical protein